MTLKNPETLYYLPGTLKLRGMSRQDVSCGFPGPIGLPRERFAWDDVTLDQARAGLIAEAEFGAEIG